MSTYCLEMRSTANWDDVRYREYTRSARTAKLFKLVPKIGFTDSGHGIVAVVSEHKGARLPSIRALRDHVNEAIDKANEGRKQADTASRRARKLLDEAAPDMKKAGNELASAAADIHPTAPSSASISRLHTAMDAWDATIAKAEAQTSGGGGG